MLHRKTHKHSILAKFSTTSLTPFAAAAVLTFPLPARAETLDLATAMELAGRNSHVSRAAQFETNQAHEKIEQAKSGFGPRLDLEATLASISKSVNSLAGKQLGTQYIPDKIESATLIATQPLTGLGPTLFRVRSEILMAKASQHMSEQSLHNAKYAGGEAFLRAAKADQLYQIAQASKTVATKQKADGKALALVGKLKQSDLLRLDLAVSEAQTQFTQAEAVRDVAFFSLAELINFPHNSVIEISDAESKSAENAFANLSSDASTFITKAENNRAEIHSLKAATDATELARKAQLFDFAPTINIFARYDRDFAKKDLDVPLAHKHNATTGLPITIASDHYAATDTRDTFTYGLSLRWNIWDWGTRNSRDSETLAKTSVLRENLEQVKQLTRIETMQAHRDLRASMNSLESAKATLKFAEEFYRQTNAQFLMGMASVLDLTAAERDQTRARAALSNARGDFALAQLKLKKAVGDDSF